MKKGKSSFKSKVKDKLKKLKNSVPGMVGLGTLGAVGTYHLPKLYRKANGKIADTLRKENPYRWDEKLRNENKELYDKIKKDIKVPVIEGFNYLRDASVNIPINSEEGIREAKKFLKLANKIPTLKKAIEEASGMNLDKATNKKFIFDIDEKLRKGESLTSHESMYLALTNSPTKKRLDHIRSSGTNAAVLAHEKTHMDNSLGNKDSSFLGRLTHGHNISALSRGMTNFGLPIYGTNSAHSGYVSGKNAALGKKTSFLTKAKGVALPALIGGNVIAQETIANLGGYKKVKEKGASKELLGKYKKTLGAAMGTYVNQYLTNIALTLGIQIATHYFTKAYFTRLPFDKKVDLVFKDYRKKKKYKDLTDNDLRAMIVEQISKIENK